MDFRDMLDLNVEVVSASYCNDDRSMMVTEAEEEDPKILEEDEEELSAGTSDSSSVVNADDPLPGAGDDNSSNPLIFGILKKEESCGVGRPEIVTRQLFPAAGGGKEIGFGLPPSSESRPQWLNLSFGGGKATGGAPAAAELKVLQQKQQQQQQQQVRKSRRGPRSRSSQYRGVTFYRRTGRWESHIWDCGKQVYLGGFDTAYAAARAYDRAAIKFRGVDADINFIIGDYDDDMKQMGNLTKEEFVHILRRQSNGASRASSKFRGVTLHKCGRWEARMGQFLGKKAAIPFNGTDLGINNHLEPRPYDHDIILDVGSQGRGGGHNQLGLDLNLGISPPSSGGGGGGGGGGGLLKTEATSSGHVRLCYSSSSTTTDMPAMPRQDLPLGYGSFAAPNHPPIWSPVYPFLLPNPEGKAATETKRAAAAEGSSKSGWKMQGGNGSGGGGGGGGNTPLAMAPLIFANNAASSGFSSSSSSSSTTPMTPHHLLHHRNFALQNPNSSPLIKPANSNSFPSLFRN